MSPQQSRKHGFEDASLNGQAVARSFGSLQPSVTRGALKKLWRNALGASADALKRAVVVGESPADLNQWKCGKESFVETICLPEQVLEPPESGDMILFLPGMMLGLAPSLNEAFFCTDLEGSILFANTGEGKIKIFNDEEDGLIFPHVSKGSKVAIVNALFRHYEVSYQSNIIVDGALRMIDCQITPGVEFVAKEGDKYQRGGIEMGSLIQVSGSLLGEFLVLGPGTDSGIECHHDAVVSLSNCLFQRLGRGDYNQRPDLMETIILRGSPPAIAVSYEASIMLRDCIFCHNYGFSVQYKNFHEQAGLTSHDVDVLKETKSPEEWAKDVLQGRINRPECWPTLSAADGQAEMLQELIRERKDEIIQAKKKKVKGSVTFIRCMYDHEDIAISPLLDAYPDRHELKLADAFAEDSSMGKHTVGNVDGQPRSFIQTELASWYNKALCPKVHEVFASLLRDDSFLEELQESAVKITEMYNPMKFLVEQHKQVKEFDVGGGSDDLRVRQAFMSLGEKDMSRLQEHHCAEVSHAVSMICKQLKESFLDCDIVQVEQVCWGCLADWRSTASDHLVAVMTLVTFQQEINVTPTRGQVLSDRLHRDEYRGCISIRNDGCACKSDKTKWSMAALYLLSKQRGLFFRKILSSIIVDDLASDHGRRNACLVLANMSFWNSDPTVRIGAIDCISRVLCTKNELRGNTRGEFVYILRGILARTCRARIRKAFECFHDIDWTKSDGGFTMYLISVGLPVDLNDRLIQHELTRPHQSPCTVDGIMEHNKMIRSDSTLERCWFCFDAFASEELHACTQCKAALYCGGKCQNAHWKTHKKTCKRKKDSK